LEICRKKKATLLIARLDRLARNVAFISNLMESRVDFVAVDMPEANRLTIHILAAVAEYEREAISKRTKDALKVAKARGTRLGNPNPLPALQEGAKVLKARTAEYHATVRPLIRELRQQGLTLAAIAQELNRRQLPTARGGLWYAGTVRNILIRRPK
jgi:DNA invertase Pin-like site-specific DNA recombinase